MAEASKSSGVGPTAVTPPTQDKAPKQKANPAEEFLDLPESSTVYAPGYDESNVGYVMQERKQPNSAVTPDATDVSIDPNHS